MVSFEQNADGLKIAYFSEPLTLKSGEILDAWHLAYETWGSLNPEKNNVVLIHHSLATSAHVASHSENPEPGWWERLIGPGKVIDTEIFYVICINNLGSCYGSIGPTALAPDNKTYGHRFPRITIEDMTHSQELLLRMLGIHQCYAVIGGSMGGMLTLYWGHRFPNHAKYLVCISMAHQAYPMHRAHRMCQREALYMDSAWSSGPPIQAPKKGLKLARMVSHLFYRGLEEVNERFKESTLNTNQMSQLTNYYNYNAEKFAETYCPYAYHLFLDAMDAFDLTEYEPHLFAETSSTFTLISTDTDMLYPPIQQEKVYQLLQSKKKDVSLIKHQSPYGHDAFLVDAQAMSGYLSEALAIYAFGQEMKKQVNDLSK